MIDEEEEDLALLSLTSSLAVTSPPLVDRMRVADLPLFLKELKIARRLATSSPIFTSDSKEKRVCEELTTGSFQLAFNQFRPALGSGCCLIDCHHAQKTSKLPYFRLF